MPGRPFKKGHDDRRAQNKGGGKPTNKFRAMCRRIAEDKVALANVKAILADHKHPQFAKVWTALCEFGHGAALRTYEVTGDLPVLKVLDSE